MDRTAAGGDGAGERPLLERIREILTRPRGNRTWDGVVRGSGAVALLGILLVVFFPDTGPLVGLEIFTIWINGPFSALFPATFEPVLMLFGRLYPPLLVAVVATAGNLYVEFLNWHLYRKVLRLEQAEAVRESRMVRLLVRLFDRAPFLTVWICAWSILPYWAVRIVAPLSDFPLRRYMWATFLGRLPKLWFFAALGAWWSVSSELLALVSVGGIALGLAVWGWKRWRGGESEEDRLTRPGAVETVD